MRKIAMALALVLVLCVLLATGVQSIKIVRANPISVPVVPSIHIGYALNSLGGYVNSTVEYKVTVNRLLEDPPIESIYYTLDEGASVTLANIEVSTVHDVQGGLSFKAYKVNILLEDLSEGNHTLVASAGGMSTSSTFIVNSQFHVTALNVLSPNDLIYFSKTVPLTFTFTGEITNAHYYLYRGDELVSQKSLNGDLTLDNLSDGGYSLYLYVTTQYGQDAKTINFSVISIPTIAGLTAILLFSFAIGLLIYYKLYRTRSNLTVTPAIPEH
jgi:hypothetical protein